MANIDPALYFLLSFHCLIGGIGTLVAQSKGYKLWVWLLLGLLGGTITFIVSLTLKDRKEPN